GTGFWFLGEAVHSPVDIRQDEADRFDNMIDVTCKTFLGLTVACARCHDHKFDAISTADYYALYGYMKSSRYTQYPLNEVPIDSTQMQMQITKGKIWDEVSPRLHTKAKLLASDLEAY